MKKLFPLLLALVLLTACGPSEADIAAAIAETEAAKPTETLVPEPTATKTLAPTRTPIRKPPTATSTPEATATPSRASAFTIRFDELADFAKTEGFLFSTSTSCFLDIFPVWVECDNYVYFYKDELSQVITIIHDGEVVVGTLMTFTDLGTKYPDQTTTAMGTIDFGAGIGLDTDAYVLTGHPVKPTRFGDFVHYEYWEGDIHMYIWLDLDLGIEIFD